MKKEKLFNIEPVKMEEPWSIILNYEYCTMHNGFRENVSSGRRQGIIITYEGKIKNNIKIKVSTQWSRTTQKKSPIKNKAFSFFRYSMGDIHDFRFHFRFRFEESVMRDPLKLIPVFFVDWIFPWWKKILMSLLVQTLLRVTRGR